MMVYGRRSWVHACVRDKINTVTWEHTHLVPDNSDFLREKDRTWAGPKRGAYRFL